MSLYGDLPQAKNSAGETIPTGHAPGWSNLMQPPALKKAPAAAGPAFKPPPSVLRAAAAGGPGRGMPARGIPITGRTGGRGPPNTPVSEGPSGAAAGTGTGAGAAPVSSGPVAMDVSGAAGAAGSGSSVQPGVVGGPGAGASQRQGPGGAGAVAAGGGGGGSSIFTRHDGRPIEDEYDPMRPNDYEEVLAARERARKAAEAEAERLAKLKEEAEERERQRKLEEERARSAAAASSSTGGSSGGGGGVMSMEEYNRRRAAMGMTGDDAFARRAAATGAAAAAAAMSGGGGGGGGFGTMGPPGDEGPAGPRKGMGLAQKLLEKMGWKEGEGLGKNRQGISNPLIAQKTNQRAAVIVEAAPNPNASRAVAEPDSKRPRVGATLTGAPSRVICMRNMVGPGQVDEELEEEVGQELTKYGKVLDVLIFEVTTPGYPEEEAVRIFVQFERQESATKAAVDLQGRFFAGRSVRVSFFPEERFTSTDLAPKQGEFD